MDYIGLGRRVKTARREHNITQEELASRIGISLSFLGHIERGSRKASMETLVKLANALEVSLDHLMRDSLIIKQEEEAPTPPIELLQSLRSPQPAPDQRTHRNAKPRTVNSQSAEMDDVLNTLNSYLGMAAEGTEIPDDFADWDE